MTDRDGALERAWKEHKHFGNPGIPHLWHEFVAGWQARDAEVAELREEVERLRRRMRVAKCNPSAQCGEKGCRRCD